jgi:hypothetical protein
MAWSKLKYQKLLSALKEAGVDIVEVENRTYHTANGKTEDMLKIVILPEPLGGAYIRDPIPETPPQPSTRLVSYPDETTGKPVSREIPRIYQLGTDTVINCPLSINPLVDAVIQDFDNIDRVMSGLRPLLKNLRVSFGYGLQSRQPISETMDSEDSIGGLQSDSVNKEFSAGSGDPRIGGEEKQ